RPADRLAGVQRRCPSASGLQLCELRDEWAWVVAGRGLALGMHGFARKNEKHSMKTHFVMMASYNNWANARLFRMAGALADELYHKDVGAYFKSLHGTLNHLL